MSNSLRPHRLQPTRLLSPWNLPGKNTAMGCHAFSRGSSWPRDWTQVAHIAGRCFTVWATREAQTYKLVQPQCKIVWKFLKKLKIELLYNPEIPLLGIYPKKMKTLIQEDLPIPMFIPVLFSIVMIWKQLKRPLIDEWIKKMWYINNGILLNLNKK